MLNRCVAAGCGNMPSDSVSGGLEALLGVSIAFDEIPALKAI